MSLTYKQTIPTLKQTQSHNLRDSWLKTVNSFLNHILTFNLWYLKSIYTLKNKVVINKSVYNDIECLVCSTHNYKFISLHFSGILLSNPNESNKWCKHKIKKKSNLEYWILQYYTDRKELNIKNIKIISARDLHIRFCVMPIMLKTPWLIWIYQWQKG